MKHLLSLSTLFPNEAEPRFGPFVAKSLETLAKRDDWKVTVVSPQGIPPIPFGKYRALTKLPEVSEERGMVVHRPPFTLFPKFGARFNASAIAKCTLPLIREIHARDPIDVIDAQFFFPDGPAAALIADKMKLPLSIKARGSDITLWGEKSFAHEQMLNAAQRADSLLAVSQDLKQQMIKLAMPEEKISVHYTGLDRDLFRPLDHATIRVKLSRELGFELPDSNPLLVCVGALNGRKGQDIAIKTLAQLADARLILVGKGDEETDLRAQAEKLSVAERVHFAGSVDHDILPVILSAADIMVLPTMAEGLANAWVEALACGTPVVTTDVGGANELISSDVAGRLVTRDVDAIAKAIRSILAYKPSPHEVAATVEKFSWENHANELASHYERLARQR